MGTTYDIIILGSGPAGLTAALYTARANRPPLLFAGPSLQRPILPPGGQLMLTTEIENYPGFPQGIAGPALMDAFREQALRFGAQILDRNVEKVDFSRRPLCVWSRTEDDTLEEYHAQTVIVATGASPRLVGLESEQRLFSRGISTCATCDGAFFRNKVVAVIGGGDSAMEEGTYLSHLAQKVYLIHRREIFRASKIMLTRTQANPKVEFLLNREIVEFLGETKLQKLRLRHVQTGQVEDLSLDGCFITIGHDPSTSIFRDCLACTPGGYLLTGKELLIEALTGQRPASEELKKLWRERSTATNIPGVFAAGDVHDHVYRQAITAAGEGCQAAIDCTRWLEEHGSGIE